MPSLSSDSVACVVKLMTNAELISMGKKIFNPLLNSQIGSKGYMGARVQPNSPTDHPEDIVWQVFDAWVYAVGDVVLGTNPVSSDPSSVSAIAPALYDILTTFGLEKTLPNWVLSHIDIQAEAEAMCPGTTGIWFQSLAGTTNANQTFNIGMPVKVRENIGSTPKQDKAQMPPMGMAKGSTWSSTNPENTDSCAPSKPTWPKAKQRKRHPGFL